MPAEASVAQMAFLVSSDVQQLSVRVACRRSCMLDGSHLRYATYAVNSHLQKHEVGIIRTKNINIFISVVTVIQK